MNSDASGNQSRRRLRRPSPALVVAMIALGVALSSPAVAKHGGPHSLNFVNALDVQDESLTGKDIKDKSLTAKEFRGSIRGARGKRGPAGRRGSPGAAGAKGDKGDTGTVDSSNFYNKAQSDGRYLGAGAKAADADKLDGLDVTAFGTTALRVVTTQTTALQTSPTDITDASVPFNTVSDQQVLVVGIFNFYAGCGRVLVGRLVVDGAVQPGEAVLDGCNIGGTVSQTWVLSLPSGAHTAKLTGSTNQIDFSEARAQTSITIVKLPKL